MLCNHISAVRQRCGGEGALLMAEGEQKWNHRSLSHGHVHVCLFFLTFLPIHHPSAILWAACLFSLKQIGKQAFLAGRKLEGKDTWGRRGTCQLKNWSFFLTQAWLLSQSYEKLFLHSLAFKISLKTLCFCHQRAENPHWRPCLCFLSGRASTHNDEAWLPPQPTGALCSGELLHQELSFVSELHQEHRHCSLCLGKLQSSFTSQHLCLCQAQLETETFNWKSSCKSLQTGKVTLQSLYTLHRCTTNFLQQQEVFDEEDTVA